VAYNTVNTVDSAVSTGSCLDSGWRRHLGRPRCSWIQQIGDGTPFSIRTEWSKAVFHVHSYQDQFIQPGWVECVFFYI